LSWTTSRRITDDRAKSRFALSSAIHWADAASLPFGLKRFEIPQEHFFVNGFHSGLAPEDDYAKNPSP
jgi:hypothetical protein